MGREAVEKDCREVGCIARVGETCEGSRGHKELGCATEIAFQEIVWSRHSDLAC